MGKLFAVFILAAATMLMFSGCAAPITSFDTAHNSRNSIDWEGVYRGRLPCADCEGIETIIVLTDDEQYRTWFRYLGKSTTIISAQGQFSWNDAGNTIMLMDTHVQYFVGENRLIHLARDGSTITGSMAEAYVLTKFSEGITGRYWKLIELDGKPVPILDREPYLILDAEVGRLTGFGGCNGFSGSFELNEAASYIRFGKIVSTMMACQPGMDIEGSFHGVLRTADSYTLTGDYLILNRARASVPLARFEIIYLH